MRASILIGAMSLAGLAAARPSQHRRHEELHEKRQNVVVYTEYSYVTATTPDVVVYLDSNGKPLYTSTVGQAAPTSIAGAVASSVTSVVAAVTSAPAAYTSAASPSAASSSSSGSSSGSSGSSSGNTGSSSGLNGISYSPYGGTEQNGNVGCKTADQVNADFDLIDSKYNLARIYGVDCNQVSNVLAAASKKNMKVMAGVYDITKVTSEIETIIAAVNGNWAQIHTVSVGNELVNSGAQSVSAVVAAVNSARTQLRAAGYTGPVVTVDTFIAIENNPELCQCSDYAAANAHPFFDGTVQAADSGKWLISTMQAVSAACGGKNTVITETGWPWGGDSNGVAVPSPSNQKAAVSSIQSAVTSNVIMFTAFNDMWKSPGYLSVEQSFGMYGNSASA